MKQFIFLFLILILLSGCSLFDSEDGTVSVYATDSNTSLTKAGLVEVTVKAGAEFVGLGYIENNDTVWVSLLDNPETFEVALKMQDKNYLGGENIKIEGYEDHVFDLFKLTVLPPEIIINDSINVAVSSQADTLNLIFSFTDGLDLTNGHADIKIDFHSEKWFDFSNLPSSIDVNNIMSSITVDPEI